jgi:primosomal protein N' (replication factor Y)
MPIRDNFNESQRMTWAKILELGFLKPLVIQGKTGSGKTNLYFAIVNTMLIKNKKVLILMPEIALTNAFADRICEHFGFIPHIWNSDISSVAKSIIWTWAMSDEPGILIGSRSALWLPLVNLGLIIVDEEHDNSYKQENSPRYHARDMAVLRKKYQNCAVVLVSATPSLETWFNVEQGKYNLVTLEGDQPITAQIIPRKAGEWISKELTDAIRDELDKGNQCMLFLNRKGLARSVFCGVCHEYVMCNYCSANLVLYRNFVVSCSYCGKQNYLNTCHKCSNNSWQTYGIGIEQIEEDIKKIFPQAVIGKFSGDLKNLPIDEIHSGKINLIISTQILAKGFNFLNLSLVGIIQADHGLQSNDPRNTEKIYQLLTQVRGRCGRNKNESKVLLQSTNSKSPVLESILKNDFVSWAQNELEFRRASKLPPIFKLIRVVVYGSNMENAAFDAKCLYHALLGKTKFEVFQPAPSQLHKYKSKFYYSIIIRYYHTMYPQPEIILSHIKLPKKSKFFIDVDPQNFV